FIIVFLWALRRWSLRTVLKSLRFLVTLLFVVRVSELIEVAWISHYLGDPGSSSFFVGFSNKFIVS
ncbi:24629_t:CDS:2, partial [Dentiscutata erythropus]